MSVTQPDAALPLQERPRAVEASWPMRVLHVLRTFARRSPMSAFWGCVAAGIVFMALAVSERDVFVMQNLVFIYAVVFVILNLVVDLISAWLDPRIRYA